MDEVSAAKSIIRCLDLTSLNNDDSELSIIKLCDKAQTPYGNVAAVCVYPKFVPQTRELLKNTNIKIATVVNFPKGETNWGKIEKEIKEALKLGADEIDAVFPYKSLISGDIETCERFLALVRERSPILKVIIETGELKKSSLIIEACKLCIDAKVDFIKTSTGKTKVSATPEVANLILETIFSSRSDVGLKVSGGIKTMDDAKKYLVLANAVMGSKWPNSQHFRIGASSLLDNLLTVIERGY